jgi:hypothetical protein
LSKDTPPLRDALDRSLADVHRTAAEAVARGGSLGPLRRFIATIQKCFCALPDGPSTLPPTLWFLPSLHGALVRFLAYLVRTAPPTSDGVSADVKVTRTAIEAAIGRLAPPSNEGGVVPQPPAAVTDVGLGGGDSFVT